LTPEAARRTPRMRSAIEGALRGFLGIANS
jgi:hypothetical protein